MNARKVSSAATQSRLHIAILSVLLLATSVVPWGLAGGHPLWSWMLFNGRAYATLGATLAAAWTLGVFAIAGSRLLKGYWRSVTYVLPGISALIIFLITTRGNLAPWTAFAPVSEHYPFIHILNVVICILSLIASGLKIHAGEDTSKWQTSSLKVFILLSIFVYANGCYSLIQMGSQLSGAAPILTLLPAAIGAFFGIRGALLAATAKNVTRILTGRRYMLLALALYFFSGMAGQMSQGQFISALFGALNNGILVAGILLITIEGMIGFCLNSPEFDSISLHRSKLLMQAMSAVAVTLILIVSIHGAHIANWMAAKPAASTRNADANAVPRVDWPQWCGGPDRNMISSDTHLPDKFDEVSSRKSTDLNNVKWVAALNSHYVFGSPVVADGKVLLGGSRRDPGAMSESAMLWCFNETDGKLLWQMRSPYITKLYNKDSFGICSTPTIENGRAYLLGHLGDVLCLDMNGQNDGNQGPFQDEAQYFSSGRRCIRSDVAENGSRKLEFTSGKPAVISPQDADILWRFDMVGEVNCFPFNALDASVLVRGDRVYAATCSIQSTTSDGSIVRIKPWEEKNKMKYDSPSLVVLDKNTGKLLARERQNIFKGTFHGAYSSPSLGKVNGEDLLVYGGGNGVCYAFDPNFVPTNDGTPAELKLIWKFDCLDPASYGPEFRIDHLRKAEIIGTPVIYNNRVYVSIGNDMIRSGDAARQGRLICLDATQTGNITSTGRIWSFDDIRSTASTVAIADGLVYTADAGGAAYCLDADTGIHNWTHNTGIVWSSPLIADGKVYLGTHGNGLFIFEHSKQKKIIFESGTSTDIVGSPAVSHGVLYVASQKYLYALQKDVHGGVTDALNEEIGKSRKRERVQSTNNLTEEPVNAPDPSKLVQTTKNWPGFRGPGGSGEAIDANPPLTWNSTSNKSISWRAALPFPGHNSPIVWENRVLLSGADRKHQAIMCFALDTGTLSWRIDLSRPHDAKIPDVIDDAGYAAPTMVTDGRFACAIFASGLLACVNLDGKIVWQKELGVPDNNYGYASSLTLWHNLLLIQFDQGSADENKSALIALDIESGQEVWRKPRPVGTSWSSPVVNTVWSKDGVRDELITCSTPYVIAYSPKDGTELWRAQCLSGEVAPSPIFRNGLIYACDAQAELSAIRCGGNNDVTATHVAWTATDDLPDTVSPICTASSLLTMSPGGMLTSYNSRSGALQWQHHFSSEQFRASPILASNRIYLTNTKGITHILEAGSAFKEIGQATLDDVVTASPACVGNSLIVRGKKTLYCLREK
jgi:outer membrane protein assembly factor BamB